VPSRYGSRYAYGHIVEENRHLLVSGGLGCTFLPLRFAMPPEVVLLELG
jgi:predicted MPP superfamily phosphohydrolase